MFITIQKLKHTIRTCHGDSDKIVGGDDWRELDPVHRVGQGDDTGSVIWAVISTVFYLFITG